jgi:hypothetical protein
VESISNVRIETKQFLNCYNEIHGYRFILVSFLLIMFYLFSTFVQDKLNLYLTKCM